MYLPVKQSLQKERPVNDVPLMVVATLLISILLQITWHACRPLNVPKASALPQPPEYNSLQLISMGEPAGLAKALMLWLQAFDHQPGLSLSYKQLDYDKVIAWLDRVLFLDSKTQYPLLSASRVYSAVQDNPKKRKMLEFVYKKFLEDPDRRWPWLAHAVYVAKYRLKDIKLAHHYANALRLNATGANVPDWAKQMEIFILEDMGDIEGAKVLLGGLIDSGAITDPNELRFLEERLDISKDN